MFDPTGTRVDLRKCVLIITGVLGGLLLYRVYFMLSTPSTASSIDSTGAGSGVAVQSSMASSNKVIFPKVILYGDSLTQQSFSSKGRWGALLTNHLERKCDVVNRGFSGYTSRWNLIMLKRFFSPEDAPHIAAVTIFLGANDATLYAENNYQHVPLDEYAWNMRKIIEELIAMGIKKEKLIIIGPPACNEVEHAKNGWSVKIKNDVTGKYSSAAEKVAAETGVHFIELFHSMMKEQNWQSLLRDGLHFSEDGSKFFFNKLWPVIDKITHHLPMVMPHFTSLRDHPEKLLLH